jgi:peptidoglycan hydrolase-like protein with peptidoglycan-binding domain
MTNRYADKASIYLQAYKNVVRAIPSKHNVLFGLSVAQHETECGDALGGNWGGTTASQVDAIDRATLNAAGLYPDTSDDLTKAQELLGDRPGLILWRDYSAQSGWYWIWFYRPSSPVDGATYFVKILVATRPTCASIMNDPSGTLDALARAMYATHYFLGDFDPDTTVTYNSQQMTGAEANIEAYRDALTSIEGVIEESLAGWTPSALPPSNPNEPPFDLYEVSGYQGALAWLATHLNHPEFNPGAVDGINGPDTQAAVRAFQTYAQLKFDGQVGEETRNALLRAIEMTSPSKTEPAPPPMSRPVS